MLFKFSHRPDLWHHTVTRWAALLLMIGLAINVIISLWEANDIGFFSANSVFTGLCLLTAITGAACSLTKDMSMVLMFGMSSCAAFVFSMQPIVMWTNEGNLCGSLSSAEQQIGRDCYTAAVNSDTGTNFANIATLVTSCYNSNSIMTGASGLCYNIRWSDSQATTLRAFMLISWLCEFTGILFCLICSVTEIIKFGSIRCDKQQLDFYVYKAVYQFYRDSKYEANSTDFTQMGLLMEKIKTLEGKEKNT